MPASVDKPKTYPDDVIAVLFSLLPSAEFSADTEKIQKSIYELQKDEEFSHLLQDFDFLERPPYPYSPLLERVLSRLQESRLLAARNPDFCVYQMSDNTREAIRTRLLPRFSSENATLLKRISEELARNLVPDQT